MFDFYFFIYYLPNRIFEITTYFTHIKPLLSHSTFIYLYLNYASIVSKSLIHITSEHILNFKYMLGFLD